MGAGWGGGGGVGVGLVWGGGGEASEEETGTQIAAKCIFTSAQISFSPSSSYSRSIRFSVKQLRDIFRRIPSFC